MPGRESQAIQGWFKPYSISLRKKGAAESVRHFCAQARLGFFGRAAFSLAEAETVRSGQSATRDAPRGRNSGEFDTEKRIIARVGADRRRPHPLLGFGAA
jgi:hypothetical protein